MGRLVRAWRIHRYGDDTGIKASEERGDEVEASRIQEQRAITRGTGLAQGECNDPCSSIQIGIRQPVGNGFARLEKRKSYL